MGRFFMTTIGSTAGEIEREIQYITQNFPEIRNIYGFGSFFRNQSFHDIDLLFVLSINDGSILRTSNKIRSLLSDLSSKLGVTLHPLILTEREFAEAPLRDMQEIVSLS
jgi:predicted nucleotidyltransferase